MKRLNFLITVFLSSLLICGCSSLFFGNGIRQIKQGMTPDEVAKVLGDPNNRRFDNEGEQWEYKRMDSPNYYTYIIIDFVNGRVVTMNTFDKDIIKPPVISVPPMIPPTFPGHQGVYKNMLMNDRDFGLLCNRIKKESFDDDKIGLLEIGTINSCFTCLQCRTILSLFTFDDDKMKAIRLMRGKIADKENLKLITDCFTFESEKENVRNAVLAK